MKQCPECQTPIVNSQAQYCPACGSKLLESPNQAGDDHTADDNDFVVTEAHSQGPEFAGGHSDFPTSDEGLEVQSTSDLVEDEAQNPSASEPSVPTDDALSADVSPIGRTDAPLPPSIDEDAIGTPANDMTTSPIAHNQNSAENQSTSPASPDEMPATKGQEQFLSDREKEEIIRKIGAGQPVLSEATSQPGEATAPPTQPATPDPPSPEMTKRGRGIAWYYRNYIQITGSQKLYADDEILINNRCYRLKPKKIRPGLIIGAGGGLFALLLVLVASLLVSNSDTGNGKIIGMALDDSGTPYVQGAIIRFPDLGVAVKSSPLGFFRSGEIPSGTYKMEYKIRNELVGEEYVTVVAGQVSTITLSPAPLADNIVAEAGVKTSAQMVPTTKVESVKNASPSGTKSTSVKKKKTASEFAKLTLAANIEGARLSLDGSVLGAGNMTYSRVKPGKRKYVVEADGYQSVSGVINLKAGDKRKLSVELQPMATAQKEKSYSAQDYYYSGVANVKAGEPEVAVADFTKAIEEKPSYAEAYLARADVYSKAKDRVPAHDDYIRAAEIFRINKDFNHAITAYNSAVKTNKTSLTAYLGRGDLYLAKGQEIAAIADYDAAKKIDKKAAAAHFGLGKARFQLGNYKKAIKHFKEARSLNSKSPVVYQYLMLSYLAVDNVKEVKKSFKKFTEVASESEIKRMATDNKYSAVLRVVDQN